VKTINKNVKSSGPARQELMKIAKAKKIANFGVLNKAELIEAISPRTTKSRIKEIQETAVKRWKSGWKSQDKKKTEKK